MGLTKLSHICAEISLDARTMRKAIERGEIPAYRVNQERGTYVDPNDVEAWIRKHRLTVRTKDTEACGSQVRNDVAGKPEPDERSCG